MDNAAGLAKHGLKREAVNKPKHLCLDPTLSRFLLVQVISSDSLRTFQMMGRHKGVHKKCIQLTLNQICWYRQPEIQRPRDLTTGLATPALWVDLSDVVISYLGSQAR